MFEIIRLRKNLNIIDRMIRALVGVVCIYLGFIEASIITNVVVAVMVGLFGTINIYAAILSYCPVYALCGVNTYNGNVAES